MKTLLLILGTITSQFAFAQSTSYTVDTMLIEEILKAPSVVSRLGKEPGIKSISKQDNHFTIIAGECSLEVQVIFESNSQPSPTHLLPPHELKVGKLHCWNNIWPR